MAIDIMQPLRYVIDLQSGLVQTPMRSQLMKGDKKANRVIVALTDGSKEADLTDVTVTGSFIRPGDAAEIPLLGTVEGNCAIVVLDDACYAQEGYCEINVALTMNGVKRTIVSLTGYVLSKGSGAYVDVSGVIPSIDDIIAQYAEMKRVTEETQEAANKANDAASHAPYVDPISKNWMIWDASAGKYVDSGVTAQGEPGPQGPPGQNGTGSGTVTGVKVDGQTYQPNAYGVVELPEMGGGVPDGGTSGQILIKKSDSNGDVEWKTPTASDVGARPDDWIPTSDDIAQAVIGTWNGGTLPQNIPVGLSYVSGATSSGFPKDYVTVLSVKQGDARTFQLLVDKTAGELMTRSSTDGATWGEWKSYASKEQTLLDAYPPGSVYITFGDKETDEPGFRFGGVWEKILGRVLIGTGQPVNNSTGSSPGTYDYAVGSMGGSTTHKHNISEGQAHALMTFGSSDIYYKMSSGVGSWNPASSVPHEGAKTASNTVGSGVNVIGATNNATAITPYIAANIWRRIE